MILTLTLTRWQFRVRSRPCAILRMLVPTLRTSEEANEKSCKTRCAQLDASSADHLRSLEIAPVHLFSRFANGNRCDARYFTSACNRIIRQDCEEHIQLLTSSLPAAPSTAGLDTSEKNARSTRPSAQGELSLTRETSRLPEALRSVTPAAAIK